MKPTDLAAIVVMGVSGSGKSTVAAALAERLGIAFADGDGFHPRANIEKMHAGIPLTDADRRPWLAAIADAIDRAGAAKRPVVIACSALKRAYRTTLVHGRGDVQLVYLKGSRALISERLAHRHGHFMPRSLLDSQFDTLEEPTPAEHAISVSIDAPVGAIVEDIVKQLDLAPGKTPA